MRCFRARSWRVTLLGDVEILADEATQGIPHHAEGGAVGIILCQLFIHSLAGTADLLTALKKEPSETRKIHNSNSIPNTHQVTSTFLYPSSTSTKYIQALGIHTNYTKIASWGSSENPRVSPVKPLVLGTVLVEKRPAVRVSSLCLSTRLHNTYLRCSQR